MANFGDLTPDNTISGGTSGAAIGNTGDRLKVDALITASDLTQASYDAFGRLRTSSPHALFESAFRYDEQPELWSSLLVNSGTLTYNTDRCAVILSAANTVGSRAVYQTRSYFKYGPSRSTLVAASFNLKGIVSGQIKRLGQYDDENGYFLELSGSSAYFAIRSKISGTVVDAKVSQSSWNVDRLDGAGESGLTIDFTKQNILQFDYQWLGSGSVRFGFVINGSVVICHKVDHANILDVLYSQTATLPIRAEIIRDTSSTSTIELTCCSIIIEGESVNQGQLRNVNPGTTPSSFATIGTRKSILSLRKKSDSLAVPVVDINTTVFPNSSDTFLVELVKNGTVAGGSWVDLPGKCQANLTSTSFVDGVVLAANYVSGGSGAVSSSALLNLREALNTSLGSDLSGNSEIFSIVVTSLTATATIYGSMNYKELV